jgi:alkylation response protein AidB-like acyl-CoA dehydrogenase
MKQLLHIAKYHMTIDRVLMPCEYNLAGKPNQGFYMMMNELPQERLLIAAICAASMEFMFESTRNYVAERKGGFQDQAKDHWRWVS